VSGWPNLETWAFRSWDGCMNTPLVLSLPCSYVYMFKRFFTQPSSYVPCLPSKVTLQSPLS
jgi:hypothetical protein